MSTVKIAMTIIIRRMIHIIKIILMLKALMAILILKIKIINYY